MDRLRRGLLFSCPNQNFLFNFSTCGLQILLGLVESTRDGGVDVHKAGRDHGEVGDTLLEMLVTSLKNAL